MHLERTLNGGRQVQAVVSLSELSASLESPWPASPNYDFRLAVKVKIYPLCVDDLFLPHGGCKLVVSTLTQPHYATRKKLQIFLRACSDPRDAINPSILATS